ncbi:MAG: hypothetical protein ACRDP7_32300 [Trebonia sp.]
MSAEPAVLQFAARVLGPCELVRDCSWEHRGSLVLRLRDSCGLAWFLKRHRDRERYEREVHAYRAWVPVLGDGAPRLRAADDDLGAVIVSARPGGPAPWPAPSADGLPADGRAAEQAVQRQAGVLLRRLHSAQPPRLCDDFGAVKAGKFARFMLVAGDLTSPRERDAARSRRSPP